MKVIELLTKIANGEEVPDNIEYEDEIYYFSNDNKAYYNSKTHHILECIILKSSLNDEIIEEDKKIPEKSILDVDSDASGSYDTVIINGAEYQISRVERYMLGKINEIIDYINGGTNGE